MMITVGREMYWQFYDRNIMGVFIECLMQPCAEIDPPPQSLIVRRFIFSEA